MSASVAALPKFTGEVEALATLAALEAQARAALESATDPAGAIARLEQAGLLPEAARFAAHSLPRREAVWWACMCARAAELPEAPAALATIRDTAEAWVRRPEDETRRKAMELAQAQGLDTPEAWCAVAAFWSGDSMAPPGLPKVPPPQQLTGTAVAGAVMLAALREGAAQMAPRLTRYLASAREIAAGGTGRMTPP